MKMNEEGPVATMSPAARSTEYMGPFAFSSWILTVVVEGSLIRLGAALIRPPNLNWSGRGSGEKRISAGSEHMTNLQSKVHTVWRGGHVEVRFMSHISPSCDWTMLSPQKVQS